ncbi:hypothetical protein BDV96DRAFT_688407 [Lophiotrema nucula]|uniref:F-box domain-containing protein n=1 Tax=Lophiotrema nucula TaxID=690887 RepID=A0A6A5Z593_9PLEO|nr:hypothetical protein BDV96DRAFT_688407 [Lophiotrema nucula]
MLLELFFLVSAAFLPTNARQWSTSDQCPTSIRTTVPGGHYDDRYTDSETRRTRPPNFGTMRSVHSALLKCPNLTSLDLRVTLLGCSEWPDLWNFPFNVEGGDRYPPLKKLRLEGYSFDEQPGRGVGLKNSDEFYGAWLPERLFDWWRSGNMQKYFQYKSLSAEQRDKTNLELWFDAMDWSQIETLGLLDNRGQHHFMDKAPRYLKSLRSLEIWGGWRGSNNTVAFVTNLEPNSLTNLTWIGGWETNDLQSILESHGQSLQHLEIRDPENDRQLTQAFEKDQLLLLSQIAPSLKHLSLNIRRNGTWPFESFSIIASSPSLETVDLWLDITSDCQRQKPQMYSVAYMKWEREFRERNESIPCQGEDRFQQPFLNESSALEVFKHMRNAKSGEQLRKVTFWAGDWSRSWDGPIYIEPWIEGRSAKVVCTTEGMVEGEAWCTVEDGGGYWKNRARWSEEELEEFDRLDLMT